MSEESKISNRAREKKSPNEQMLPLRRPRIPLQAPFTLLLRAGDEGTGASGGSEGEGRPGKRERRSADGDSACVRGRRRSIASSSSAANSQWPTSVLLLSAQAPSASVCPP